MEKAEIIQNVIFFTSEITLLTFFTSENLKLKTYGIDVKPSNSASKDAFCTTVLR